MEQRSVLIYCDADLRRGMGHLVRSLSLAEEARRRGWLVTVTGSFGDQALEHAAALAPGQKVTPLSASRRLEELRELLTTCGAGVLHVDSYDTALDSFRPADVLVSNMQDGMFGRRMADLHIDANLDAELLYQPLAEGERAIIGTAGMQIRETFRAQNHNPLHSDAFDPFKVLVLLGGTDATGLTPRLAQVLAAHDAMKLTVICRPEAQAALVDALRASAVQVELLSFTSDLPGLISTMDAVITAAGTSVWDFAAVGIPMGILAVTDNQLPGYRACIAHGLGHPLGEPPHADLEEKAAEFVKFLKDRGWAAEQTALGRQIVDGLGSWRVVSAWEELLERAQSTVAPASVAQALGLNARIATVEDAGRLLEWRNDEATRVASRSREPVAWADHVTWLETCLADPDRRLFIIEGREGPVATVRWDRRSTLDWEISITIAPEHRGRGLAREVLATGEAALDADGPARLLAGVHAGNAASRRLFMGAGYLPQLPPDVSGFEMRAKWRLRCDGKSGIS